MGINAAGTPRRISAEVGKVCPVGGSGCPERQLRLKKAEKQVLSKWLRPIQHGTKEANQNKGRGQYHRWGRETDSEGETVPSK